MSNIQIHLKNPQFSAQTVPFIFYIISNAVANLRMPNCLFHKIYVAHSHAHPKHTYNVSVSSFFDISLGHRAP